MFGFAAGALVFGVGAGAVGVDAFGAAVCAGAAVAGGGAGSGVAGAAVRVRCAAAQLAQLRIAITEISRFAIEILLDESRAQPGAKLLCALFLSLKLRRKDGYPVNPVARIV
jgi:hypothetical protein